MDQSAAPDGEGWRRDTVTFRLNASRKLALRGLLGEGPGSPTEAIDLAIARAVDGEQADSEAKTRARDADLSAGILAALADMRASLDRMDDRLADAPAGRAPSDPWLGAMTLADWADASMEPGTTWLAGKARWIAAQARGPARLALLVSLENASRPKMSADLSARLVALPSLALAAISAFDSARPAVLACWRERGRWLARLHAQQADGTLGPALDEFDA